MPRRPEERRGEDSPFGADEEEGVVREDDSGDGEEAERGAAEDSAGGDREIV